MTTNSKEYQRRYYEKNKEKIKASQRAYYEKQKEIKKLNVSFWLHQPNPRLFDMKEDYKTGVKEKFQSIPKKELTYSQRYYAENREKIRAQQKESRERRKKRDKQREYYAANREHLCELQRKNYAKRQRKKKLSKTFLGRVYLRIFG